jgi:hypothetical protein
MQYNKISNKNTINSPLNLSILTSLNKNHLKKLSTNFNDY